MSWVLYGAKRCSGELTARAAVARGLRPVLAGRARAPLATLDSPASLATALSGAAVVLNRAGPFSATARPMLAACRAAGAHHLDITGEIAVFELAETRSGAARAAGIVVWRRCPPCTSRSASTLPRR
jgi:short subunit dehydrogenase-like uncharacterized protein